MIGRIAATVLCLLGASTPQLAAQSTYPTRPIRLFVPYAAGGASDIMARYFGDKLGQALGQQVVIDNQPGASGIIAYGTVARATADGYTLAYGTPTMVVNAVLKSKLPYDPIADFAAVTSLFSVQNVLVVTPSLPVKTVAELVAYAKARPGELNFVSLGPGSTPHLTGELFKAAAGVDIQPVSYKLGTQGQTDLVGGRVQLWFSSMPSILPLIQSGQVRALAVGGATRSPALPDVPTLIEAGILEKPTTFWNGLFAPKGTPQTVIDRLAKASHDILAQREVAAYYATIGVETAPSTQRELAATVDAELATWTKLSKDIGLHAE